MSISIDKAVKVCAAAPEDYSYREVLVSGEVMSRLMRHLILNETSETDIKAVGLVESARPKSLREFDQIPMRRDDLL